MYRIIYLQSIAILCLARVFRLSCMHERREYIVYKDILDLDILHFQIGIIAIYYMLYIFLRHYQISRKEKYAKTYILFIQKCVAAAVHHLPIQKVLNIMSNISLVLTCPVILPSSLIALCISSAAMAMSCCSLAHNSK